MGRHPRGEFRVDREQCQVIYPATARRCNSGSGIMTKTKTKPGKTQRKVITVDFSRPEDAASREAIERLKITHRTEAQAVRALVKAGVNAMK